VARPRKKAAAAAKIVRRRDYAAEYRRRQERARAAGFENYYGQRIRGGASRATPTTPRATGARLRAARGHASAEDFIRELRPGALVEVTDYGRGADGQVRRLGLLVTDEDGREHSYNISHAGLRGGGVAAMLAAVSSAGAIDSPKYGIGDLFEHENPTMEE
jgi:hypothetical protein